MLSDENEDDDDVQVGAFKKHIDMRIFSRSKVKELGTLLPGRGTGLGGKLPFREKGSDSHLEQ